MNVQHVFADTLSQKLSFILWFYYTFYLSVATEMQATCDNRFNLVENLCLENSALVEFLNMCKVRCGNVFMRSLRSFRKFFV